MNDDTKRLVERSTTFGRTWEPTSCHLRSPLAQVLERLPTYEVYDDGLGNLYRWREAP